MEICWLSPWYIFRIFVKGYFAVSKRNCCCFKTYFYTLVQMHFVHHSCLTVISKTIDIAYRSADTLEYKTGSLWFVHGYIQLIFTEYQKVEHSFYHTNSEVFPCKEVNNYNLYCHPIPSGGCFIIFPLAYMYIKRITYREKPLYQRQVIDITYWYYIFDPKIFFSSWQRKNLSINACRIRRVVFNLLLKCPVLYSVLKWTYYDMTWWCLLRSLPPEHYSLIYLFIFLLVENSRLYKNGLYIIQS